MLETIKDSIHENDIKQVVESICTYADSHYIISETKCCAVTIFSGWEAHVNKGVVPNISGLFYMIVPEMGGLFCRRYTGG